MEPLPLNPNTTLDLVAGARPNFVKLAAIVHALEAHQREGGALRYRIVHTGQHYDPGMSGAFFRQLRIPEPDLNLEVGSGSQAEQTGAIMVRYEAAVEATPPAATLVVGDVNSTLACALVAKKAGIPVAHVEAGIRSGDWSMPEEVNRIVTDALADWFFTTSEGAGANLRRAGVSEDRIFFVGNTMIDTLLKNLDLLTPPPCWKEEGLEQGEYVVLTLHRPSNVDGVEAFSAMLRAVAEGCGALPVIFPVHPRTRETLARIHGLPGNLRAVVPQPYLEFNYLVRHARAVVTDSGGVTEEATVLGVPCLTLRNTTERPETVEIGTNELVGTNPRDVGPALERVFSGQWKRGGIPPRWDGRAGERIVEHLARMVLPR